MRHVIGKLPIHLLAKVEKRVGYASWEPANTFLFKKLQINDVINMIIKLYYYNYNLSYKI